jgi:hypothetical protein
MAQSLSLREKRCNIDENLMHRFTMAGVAAVQQIGWQRFICANRCIRSAGRPANDPK